MAKGIVNRTVERPGKKKSSHNGWEWGLKRKKCSRAVAKKKGFLLSVVGRTRHNVFQLQQPKFMFPIRRQKKKKKDISMLEEDCLWRFV